MRIFVGYGYNERDKWIEDFVFPLLVALDCEVLHGKVVYGGELSGEVTKAIRTADAMIGFTTRREPDGAGQYRTHPWVAQELTVAYAQDPPIPWVEVREEEVIPPGGILESADTQRIDYREADRAGCLIKIAQAARRFREMTSITTIRIRPVAAVEQISPWLDDPSFSCTCQTLRGALRMPAQRSAVYPIKGGVFVQLRGVAQGDLVRITIAARGRTWRSDFESVDTIDVHVKE